MGFSSMDDLINEVTTNGKTETLVYQKTLAAAAIAGYWHELGTSGGSIPASTYGGANLTFTATDDTWSEGALYHGGDKSTDTKHFLSAGASLYNATGAPWILMCVDQVGYAKVTSVTTTGAQAITMTPISNTTAKVDRYANGEGLRMYVSASATMGATTGTVSLRYTNVAGTTNQATASYASTGGATAVTGVILNSGPAANKYGPFIPLAAGDTGVKDIESINLTNTHTSGTMVIHLVKPLFTIPIPANGIHTMLDFVNSIPSMQQIKDGANLRFIAFNTAATPANSTCFVNMDVAWG